MKTATQTAAILALLKSGESITQMRALRKFGCWRLSARIQNLKDAKWQIEKTRVKAKGSNFARYTLASKRRAG